MKKKSELFFSVLLIPLDAIMIFAGFIVAYFWRTSWGLVPVKGSIWEFEHYLTFCLYLLPLWIIIFALEGLYSIKKIRQGLAEATSIFMGVSAGVTVVVIWLFFSKTDFFSRLIVLYIWIVCVVFMILGRLAIRMLKSFLYRFNIGVKRVLMIGWDNQIEHIAGKINANKGLGYKMLGYLFDHKKDTNFKYLGKEEDLDNIVKQEHPDEVILSDTNVSDEKMAEILSFCNENKIVFKVIPNAFEMKASNITATTMEEIPVLVYSRTPLAGWGRVTKRLIDLIGSTIGLIVTSPIFLLIAIAIKIDSKGPVFFRQLRVGNSGNFMFYKFRSMKIGADKEHEKYIQKYGNMFKLKDDPRTTKVGRFIRKTSLDELAQLINVFLGQMSLVGPRPPMVEEVNLYTKFQKQRLGIKPGITGLWQVSGRSDISFDEWVSLDVFYIENWSLWMDIKILLRTIWVVFAGKGAY